MMIFKETWQQVLDGTKTQTRRPVKEGDEGIGHRWKDGKWLEIDLVRSKTGRLKWMIGDGYMPRTYAIEPGRGKKAVGRIRITKIRRERLQEITQQDAFAEGVPKSELIWAVNRFAELWDRIYRKPCRWEDNPEVWVLEFELVEKSDER